MPVPNLEDYGISPLSGFLPEDVPLKRLPSEFDELENIAGNLPDLIASGQLRSCCDQLSAIQVGKMHDIRLQRRAYSLLGFLANAYVWSPPEVCDQLPNQLAEPLIILGKRLGLPPLSTYAGLCLWNFSVIDERQPWTLDNLATSLTFTGSSGESWFYLVSVALEKQGGPCLANGLGALKACQQKDIDGVLSCLERLTKDIETLSTILMRMSEKLDPQFFYHHLRPYLAGWKNMQSAGLPYGVRYGDEVEYRQYSGGSNGQSSLIQALDIILNVEHHALGHRTPLSPVPSSTIIVRPSTATHSSNCDINKPVNPFLSDMRNYMPREHRLFLTDLEKAAVLRSFVVNHGSDHKELADKYDACLKALREFRSKHIQIVMRYISLQSAKIKNTWVINEDRNLSGSGLSKSNGKTGTGGTELMPFLKQTRDEVSDSAVGVWSRNILTSKKY